MSEGSKPHSSHETLAAPIKAALNHHELVPPQADDETIELVNGAWDALHEMWKVRRDLEEQLEALRRTTYDMTPVDCLISELRDLFVKRYHVEGEAYTITQGEFESRVRLFKEEVSNPATKVEP